MLIVGVTVHVVAFYSENVEVEGVQLTVALGRDVGVGRLESGKGVLEGKRGFVGRRHDYRQREEIGTIGYKQACYLYLH